MTESQQSLSSLKAAMRRITTRRKRSADETGQAESDFNKGSAREANSTEEEKFEFQGMSDNPISKVSMASS